MKKTVIYKPYLSLKIIAVIFIFLQSSLLFSQRGNSNEMSKLPLSKQFDYIYEKSSTYQTYKVINKGWFLKIKKNVTDSVQSLQNQLENSKRTISEQKETISNTNLSLKKSNEKIEELTDEKESISFLGIPLKKGVYNTLMFTIIAVLASLLGFFIFRFKNSNQVTKKTKKDLAELNNEFEDHRIKALEREQKVRRELQDLINKTKSN